jgi:hypothetical protein
VLGGNVGALLSHNIFAYCNNNPVNGKDPNGFRPVYTQGEETAALAEASYRAMNKAAKARAISNMNSSISTNVSSGNSGFTYKSSTIATAVSGAVDKIGGVVSGFIIKGKTVWKSFENLTIGTYVSEFSGGANFAKKGLGLVGTVGLALMNVKKSYEKKNMSV